MNFRNKDKNEMELSNQFYNNSNLTAAQLLLDAVKSEGELVSCRFDCWLIWLLNPEGCFGAWNSGFNQQKQIQPANQTAALKRNWGRNGLIQTNFNFSNEI